MKYPFRSDLALLHLPERARVNDAYSLVDLKPGDRVNCQIQTMGGREVYHVEIVRAWAYPHPSHEMSDKGCLGCGATSANDGLRDAVLAAPCANERCERCGVLNGLVSASCTDHAVPSPESTPT